jgi:nitrate/nitrite transporter NarK
MMTTLYLSGFLDPLVGWFCDRHGPNRVTTLGSCLSTPCLIALRLVNENTTGKKVLLAFLLVSVGFTASLAVVGLSAEIAYAVEAMETNSSETTDSTIAIDSSSSRTSVASTTSGEKAETMLAQAYSLI